LHNFTRLYLQGIIAIIPYKVNAMEGGRVSTVRMTQGLTNAMEGGRVSTVRMTQGLTNAMEDGRV